MTPTTERSAPSATRALSLDVELLGDDRQALVRVLCTLQRRRCEVTRVDYRGATRDRPGRLVVDVVPPASHAHAVPAWLGNLVDVAYVRAR